MKRTIAALSALIFLTGCTASETEDSSAETETTTVTTTTVTTTVTTAVTTAQPDDSSEPADPQTGFKPIYDITPMLDAYRSGDRSGLDEFQTAALEKAEQVIAEVVTEDMDAYTKELAVHDWLITNCTYDPGELRAIPKMTEHSDEPYGALMLGNGICSGYSTAFQLMMSMLDIPCVIIHSTDKSDKEHAWNAVELDGSWYYVDVTWDDPIPDSEGRPVRHDYFNVLYDKLAEDHNMNDDCPETLSTDNCYVKRESVGVMTAEDIAAALASGLGRGQNSAVIRIAEDSELNDKVRFTKGNVYFDKEISDSFGKAVADDRKVLFFSELWELDGENYIMISMSFR